MEERLGRKVECWCTKKSTICIGLTLDAEVLKNAHKRVFQILQKQMHSQYTELVQVIIKNVTGVVSVKSR